MMSQENKKIEKQIVTKIITDGRDEHRLQTTIFLPSNLAKKKIDETTDGK